MPQPTIFPEFAIDAPMPAGTPVPPPDRDELVIRAWLHGRSPNTASAYRRDVDFFVQRVGKPLAQISLPDLQHYANSMPACAPATRGRRLAAVRSLLTFATGMGVLQADIGKALRLEKSDELPPERILTETEMARFIGAARTSRDRAMFRLLYGCGLRASELTGLRWRDLTTVRKGAEARILGKGRKQRTVHVPPALWRELLDLERSPLPEAFVFRGERGGQLLRQVVWRLVRSAAKRAGLEQLASPHWLRHSHASHALDNGASLQTVQKDLGHASAVTTSRYLHKRKGEASSNYLPAMR